VIGRVAGPAWIVLGIIGYLVYRKRKGLPILRSQKHDWRKAQVGILREAGELELMDEYLENLRKMKAKAAASAGPAPPPADTGGP
jgi:hypothetical protein